MRILYVSDIHANYPALQSAVNHFRLPFDLILNGGDTLVYGPFPNETINWMRENQALSILGNTDRHILTLLNGDTFKKPKKAEKRIMYGWTVAELSPENRTWLRDQPLSRTVKLNIGRSLGTMSCSIGMYHGSPDDPDEFLFANTPECRFREIAERCRHRIITVGHSHSPFHKHIKQVHFINPGSIGRMFDGRPHASCAVITITKQTTDVKHYRIPYPVEDVVAVLENQRLPVIYQEMYRRGRKLN